MVPFFTVGIGGQELLAGFLKLQDRIPHDSDHGDAYAG